MTIRETVLGSTDDERVRIAAALRAVDAALAACESARLALLSIVTPAPLSPQAQPSGGCPHPVAEWKRIATFGEAAVFCGVCGERVDA